MKIRFLMFVTGVLLATNLAFADGKIAGYLVITLHRHSYTADEQPDGSVKRDSSDLKQSYKVPLSTEFLAQFKNLPSQNSMGTGLYIAGRSNKVSESHTGFTWWIRRTKDGKLSINMWGQGAEEIKGKTIHGRNPSVSQYLTLPNWEALDMTYQLGFVNDYSGVNFGFSVAYVVANDPSLANIPQAEILKADRTSLFVGEKPQCDKMLVNGGFQEG